MLKYDDSIIGKMSTEEFKEYIRDSKNYGAVAFGYKRPNPRFSWILPLVTGHKYRFHWRTGRTFDNLLVTTSMRW